MIETIKKSKGVDINWLRNTPESWEIRRIKDIINKISSGVTPKGGSETYVDTGIPLIRSQNVYNDGLRLENVSFISDEVHSKMSNSKVEPLDVLINITGASIGRACVVPDNILEANINQHIICLRTKREKVEYLAYYLQSNSVQEYIMSIQAGSSKEALNMAQTLNIPIPQPNDTVQRKITSYLDSKTQAIDRKIKLLQEKIAIYKEYEISLINETVTKGLDKNTKLKNSGVKWLGDIPEHWVLDRLKNVSVISTGKRNSEDYDIDGYYPFFVRSKEIKTINSFSFDEEAVLTAGDGDIGKIFHYINGKFDVHQRVYCIRKFKKTLQAKYLYYYLSAKLYDQARINNSNSIVNSLRLPLFRDFKVLLPKKKEQTEIVHFLEEKTELIDEILRSIKKQIKTLKELRKTLINDVVTGKIKVID